MSATFSHVTDNKRFVSMVAVLLRLPLFKIQDQKSQNRQRSASCVWIFPTVTFCHRQCELMCLWDVSASALKV